MVKSIYLLVVWFFVAMMACSAQDCNNLPNTFTSPAQATQIVKKAKFHYLDHIDTKTSSWIRSATYYSCNGKLGFFLLVTKTGKEYLFQDMPIDVWNQFRAAKSHGVFYNRNIRNQYLLQLEYEK